VLHRSITPRKLRIDEVVSNTGSSTCSIVVLTTKDIEGVPFLDPHCFKVLLVVPEAAPTISGGRAWWDTALATNTNFKGTSDPRAMPAERTDESFIVFAHWNDVVFDPNVLWCMFVYKSAWLCSQALGDKKRPKHWQAVWEEAKQHAAACYCESWQCACQTNCQSVCVTPSSKGKNPAVTDEA
jgi:hypothetical protein